MYNDEEKEIQSIINHYQELTQDISDEIAVTALDLPRDFAIIDLSALAGTGHIGTTTRAVLYAVKLGFAAGLQNANKAHCCQK